MASFIGRLGTSKTLTAAVVGGAVLAGAYYYGGTTLSAGAAPGERAFSLYLFFSFLFLCAYIQGRTNAMVVILMMSLGQEVRNLCN